MAKLSPQGGKKVNWLATVSLHLTHTHTHIHTHTHTLLSTYATLHKITTCTTSTTTTQCKLQNVLVCIKCLVGRGKHHHAGAGCTNQMQVAKGRVLVNDSALVQDSIGCCILLLLVPKMVSLTLCYLHWWCFSCTKVHLLMCTQFAIMLPPPTATCTVWWCFSSNNHLLMCTHKNEHVCGG